MLDTLWRSEPLLFIQSWVGSAPGWTPVARFLSLMGDTAGALVLFCLMRWRAGRMSALALVGLFMLTGLVDLALWELVGLPRPSEPGILVRDDPAVSSFPSGHTVTSLALFGWLARQGQLPRVVPWGVVPLVMLSRLYLGAHYLGDVLAGVLIGLLLLWSHTRSWPVLRRWAERRSFRFWASNGIGMVATMSTGVFLFGGDRRAWQVLGYFAGLVVGLLLEHRFLRHSPATEPHARRFGEMAFGFAVLLALLGPAHLGATPPVQGLLYFLAMLWGTFLFPTLLATWHRRGRPETTGTSRHRSSPPWRAPPGSTVSR